MTGTFGRELPKKCGWLIPTIAGVGRTGLLLAVLSYSLSAQAQETLPEAPPPPEPWYQALEFKAFADAYANLNYNLPKPQENANSFRSYDLHQGFALSWVGADVSYHPSPVGGRISLRLGPTAERIAESCLSQTTRCDSRVVGLNLVSQAYGSWKPWRGITLDVGKFSAIHGAEVAESQDNLNYTRGVVYGYAQPLFHTGLRANFLLVQGFEVTALVTNGWNNTIDNNVGKTLGVQARFTPSDRFRVALGWLGGPEQDDSTSVTCSSGTAYDPAQGLCAESAGALGGTTVVDRGGANALRAWRHLADLVVQWTPSPRWTLLANVDFGTQGTRHIRQETYQLEVRQENYFGAMLATRYAVDSTFAVALRGEYLNDRHGLTTGINQLQLATGTLTLEAQPSQNLLFRLEGRGDFALDAEAGTQVFRRHERDLTSHQLTTLVGMVVRTN